MTPDIINGLFEFLGALLIANNSRVLLRDKHVAGFHWSTVSFFMVWGLWNIFYYPNLDQWVSFAGGIAVVWANMVWLALTLYYIQKTRRLNSIRSARRLNARRQRLGGEKDLAEKAANGCGDK